MSGKAIYVLSNKWSRNKDTTPAKLKLKTKRGEIERERMRKETKENRQRRWMHCSPEILMDLSDKVVYLSRSRVRQNQTQQHGHNSFVMKCWFLSITLHSHSTKLQIRKLCRFYTLCNQVGMLIGIKWCSSLKLLLSPLRGMNDSYLVINK